jgi:Ca-activated chloride channel homolog
VTALSLSSESKSSDSTKLGDYSSVDGEMALTHRFKDAASSEQIAAASKEGSTTPPGAYAVGGAPAQGAPSGYSGGGAGGAGGGRGGADLGVPNLADNEKLAEELLSKRRLAPARSEVKSLHRIAGEQRGLSAGGGLAPIHLAEEGRNLRESESDSFRYRKAAPPQFDPTASGDRFAAFVPNKWNAPISDPLSTFSIDVDTASYAKIRQLLNEQEQLPSPNAVRIEEMVNYFDYKYAAPTGDTPFSSSLALGTCPWNPDNQLVRVAIQAKKVDMAEREAANVVLLIDVSGSMDQPNKLPLVKRAVQTFVRQMRRNDRVAIVVYAGAAGLVLPSTSGREQTTILDSIERLRAGGSTNGGQGIQLAYSIARENFVANGINRVILCTDGDFNVGVTGDDALVELVKENARSKVFLTCLGFGVGNFNDAMMEKISNEGNGVYGFVDNDREARRWMCDKIDSSLIAVAKDVKIQIEFNPSAVGSYRLVGYENRILKHEDFNNDRKDAGDVNAGHRVTAFYEVTRPGQAVSDQPVDELKYAPRTLNRPIDPPAGYGGAGAGGADGVSADEMLTLKVRFKKPEEDVSKKLEFTLKRSDPAARADTDFEWAAAVAQFGFMLREPRQYSTGQWRQLVERVDSLLVNQSDSDHEEFGSMVRKANRLVNE